MNRRKKVKSILKKKEKMSNRHNNISNKPKYISKADRAALDAEQNATPSQDAIDDTAAPLQED
jgi:hypothetical protein